MILQPRSILPSFLVGCSNNQNIHGSFDIHDEEEDEEEAEEDAVWY
jgi:hypothetical protein